MSMNALLTWVYRPKHEDYIFPTLHFLYTINAIQLLISMVVINDIAQFHNTSQTCIHKLGSYLLSEKNMTYLKYLPTVREREIVQTLQSLSHSSIRIFVIERDGNTYFTNLQTKTNIHLAYSA